MHRSNDAGDPEIAARIALFVMRSVLKVRVPPGLPYATSDGGEGLTAEEVVRRLLPAAKPVECYGEVEDRYFRINWGPITPNQAYCWRVAVKSQTDGGLIGREGLEEIKRRGTDVILLLGGGDAFRVRFADLNRYQREYRVVGHYFSAGGYPPPELDDIAYVVEFSPAYGHLQVFYETEDEE